MNKKHADTAALESFYASAAAMMDRALKHRLGFTCVVDPSDRKAIAKMFDHEGQPMTEAKAVLWKQLDMFADTTDTKAPTKGPKTKRPTTRRTQRVWLRQEQWDGCDGATQAELTEPLAGSSIEWETRPEGLTAVVPGDVFAALAELCETLAVDLFTGETPPPFEAPEEPAPVSEALRWGFDPKTLATLSDEAVAAFEAIASPPDLVFLALPSEWSHRAEQTRPAWWTLDTFAGPKLRDLMNWRDEFKVGVFEREHTPTDATFITAHLTQAAASDDDISAALREAVRRARERHGIDAPERSTAKAPRSPRKGDKKRARATA